MLLSHTLGLGCDVIQLHILVNFHLLLLLMILLKLLELMLRFHFEKSLVFLPLFLIFIESLGIYVQSIHHLSDLMFHGLLVVLLLMDFQTELPFHLFLLLVFDL